MIRIFLYSYFTFGCSQQVLILGHRGEQRLCKKGFRPSFN